MNALTLKTAMIIAIVYVIIVMLAQPVRHFDEHPNYRHITRVP